LDITSIEAYNELHAAEQEYFTKMVGLVKESGANLVICQWGFDDEVSVFPSSENQILFV
jgi:T-complex protein 1 subunit epsilon